MVDKACQEESDQAEKQQQPPEGHILPAVFSATEGNIGLCDLAALCERILQGTLFPHPHITAALKCQLSSGTAYPDGLNKQQFIHLLCAYSDLGITISSDSMSSLLHSIADNNSSSSPFSVAAPADKFASSLQWQWEQSTDANYGPDSWYSYGRRYGGKASVCSALAMHVSSALKQSIQQQPPWQIDLISASAAASATACLRYDCQLDCQFLITVQHALDQVQHNGTHTATLVPSSPVIVVSGWDEKEREG